MMRKVLGLLLALVAGPAAAQQQTFLSYVTGLPAAGAITGAELLYLAQGGVSKKLGVSQLLAQVGALAPLPPGQIWIGSAGGLATPQTPAGDLTLSGAAFILNPPGPGLGKNASTLVLSSPVFAAVRLTLTQSTPVTQTDVTAATALFVEPYNGNLIALYNGSIWIADAVPAATISLPATQTQTCTTHTSTTIDGCADTSQMAVGEQITGTNIAANTTIATVVSATSFTVNNATTGNGAVSLTFKLPPSTLYDVFGYDLSGTFKLAWGLPWSNDTTRAAAGALALQDGVEVMAIVHAWRLIGTVRTTSVAGQLEDSKARRWVSNRYNTVGRPMAVVETTSTWNYSANAWRQANGNTANQLDFVSTVARNVWAMALGSGINSTATARNCQVGVGVNSTSVDSSVIRMVGTFDNVRILSTSATYFGAPGVGRVPLMWLEHGDFLAGGDTQTWFGDFHAGVAGATQTGIFGEIPN